MQTPTIGRIVHYKPADHDTFHEERPAIVVRVWSPDQQDSAVQLQVFMDDAADGRGNDRTGPLVWKTSVLQGAEPGQYHFHEDCA